MNRKFLLRTYKLSPLKYTIPKFETFWVKIGDVTGGSQWGCSKHGTRLIFWMFHATRLTPLRPSTNNTVIWTKIIHDTRLIFSLFHDTRLIFWMFHATRLTPLRPSYRRSKLRYFALKNGFQIARPKCQNVTWCDVILVARSVQYPVWRLFSTYFNFLLVPWSFPNG